MKKFILSKRLIIGICVSVVIFSIVILWVFTIHVYNSIFDKRYETYEPISFYIDDFEWLTCTEYQFPSDSGQMLQGYLYNATDNPHGIVVLAHGFDG